jgi:glycosyltransferase involved in cell wall biosynthesis
VAQPLVTFGLPVYNGADDVRTTLDAVLAQTNGDLELLVSDNASTDATPDIVNEYAARDPRVRLHRNPTNVGISGNFNGTFHLSRGKYFRWISVGDWVEPRYSELCVAALEREPRAICVTTHVAFWDENGQKHYREYHGQRVTGETPHERFWQAIALMLTDYRHFDPMYSLYRRDALARTSLERPIAYTDFALTSELALLGPFTHVPECLAHRNRPIHFKPGFLKNLAPPGSKAFAYPPLELLEVHRDMIRAAGLSPWGNAVSTAAALRFFTRLAYMRSLWPLRGKVTHGLRDAGVPIDRAKAFVRSFGK